MEQEEKRQFVEQLKTLIREKVYDEELTADDVVSALVKAKPKLCSEIREIYGRERMLSVAASVLGRFSKPADERQMVLGPEFAHVPVLIVKHGVSRPIEKAPLPDLDAYLKRLARRLHPKRDPERKQQIRENREAETKRLREEFREVKYMVSMVKFLNRKDPTVQTIEAALPRKIEYDTMLETRRLGGETRHRKLRGDRRTSIAKKAISTRWGKR